MNASVDHLLASFQQTRSDENFRELVSRYSGLVHATATRLLSGDQSAADDVSQQVFLRLFGKASSLSPRICLAGWLYRQTCRISSDHRRSAARRTVREQAAHTQMIDQETTHFIEGVDEALASLPEPDRDVILLRYFEEQSHRDVGDSLGISEEAARKRCARAVESLRAFFGRKGQVFSVGTLGVLLTGLATKPLSAGTLTKLVPQAVDVIPKSSPILSFVAGLVLGGVSAGSAIFIVSNRGNNIALDSPETSERTMASALKSVSSNPGFQSMETVIERVRLLMRLPRNTVRAMELEALFDSLPTDQRGLFFVAAKDVLSIAEKRFCYSGFLKYWMEEAPEEAMELCLSEDIEEQLMDLSTHLVQNIFADWVRNDPSLSADWLRRNWQHPALDAPGFPHTLKVAMSHGVIRQILSKDGVEAAFEMAKTFGGSKDFALVSEVITGTLWNQVQDNQGVEIYRYLLGMPDSTERDEMVQEFIGNWKRFASTPTDGAMGALVDLEPAERLPVELALLGEYVRETRKKVFADGSSMMEAVGEEPTKEDRALRRRERENAFRETARLAGLDDEQANGMIAKFYLGNEREDASEILKHLPSTLELDVEIRAATKRACNSSLPLRGSAKSEMKAFRYVQFLSSAEEKIALSRAVFRRVISKNPHDARALLASPGISPKIAQALREVAQQSSL